MCLRATHRSTFLIFALLWLTAILASPILQVAAFPIAWHRKLTSIQDAELQQRLENALKTAAQRTSPDNSNHAEAEEEISNLGTSAGRADPLKGAHPLARQTVPVRQNTLTDPAKGTFAPGDYPAIERPRSDRNTKPVSTPGQAPNTAPAEIKDPNNEAPPPVGNRNEPSLIQLFDHPVAQAAPKMKEDQPEIEDAPEGRIQLFGRPHTANQQLLGS